MASKTMLIAAVVIIVLLLVGGGYYISKMSNNNNAVEIDITITQSPNTNLDYYSPMTATVKEGSTVTMVVYDDDDSNHGTVLPTFHIDFGSIPAGHTERETFVANMTGTFAFYAPASDCSGGAANGCAAEQDINGTLTVTP